MLSPEHATCRVFSLTAPRGSAFMLLIGLDYGQFRRVARKPCHETYVILRAFDRHVQYFLSFSSETLTRLIARVVENVIRSKSVFNVCIIDY